MRVIIAPDKFKGSLGAPGVARAMAAGWRSADPRADIEEIPVADGGEGTLDALVAALGGELRTATVSGPLGDPLEATFGIARTDRGVLGIVEMARASGLHLVPRPKRDVRRASTFGTGELILAAARAGAERLLVCIGGSATNDGGAGMAQALGVRLLDERGAELGPGGAALAGLARIDATALDPAVRALVVTVACDVDNPLTGPRGASAVYGPQKGAGPEEVRELDRALGWLAAVVRRDLAVDVRDLPGAGAAGGLGAGLVAFLGARLRRGFEVVADVLGLGARIDRADAVVTGEGRFDGSSLHGKAPKGVLDLASEAGCRTVLIVGQLEEGVEPKADVVLSLLDRAGLEACMTRTAELLADAAREAAVSLGA